MGNIPLLFTPFSFLLWEYSFLGSCLTMTICCMNSGEAMWFQPGLVVFGERRWGIGSELAWSIQRCFLFLRRGWVPARPRCQQEGHCPLPGRRDPCSYFLFFLSVLSVSREEVLPEQMGLCRKPSLHIVPFSPNCLPFPLLILCPLPHMLF